MTQKEADEYNNDPAYQAWGKLPLDVRDAGDFIDFAMGYEMAKSEYEATQEIKILEWKIKQLEEELRKAKESVFLEYQQGLADGIVQGRENPF